MDKDDPSLLHARLRWQTTAALSVFRNMDMAHGYAVLKIHLEGISSILDRIDAANDAARKVRSIERKTRNERGIQPAP